MCIIKTASEHGLMLCNGRNLHLLCLGWQTCRVPQHKEQKKGKKKNSLASYFLSFYFYMSLIFLLLALPLVFLCGFLHSLSSIFFSFTVIMLICDTFPSSFKVFFTFFFSVFWTFSFCVFSSLKISAQFIFYFFALAAVFLISFPWSLLFSLCLPKHHLLN